MAFATLKQVHDLLTKLTKVLGIIFDLSLRIDIALENQGSDKVTNKIMVIISGFQAFQKMCDKFWKVFMFVVNIKVFR